MDYTSTISLLIFIYRKNKNWDAPFLESVETVPSKWNWNLDQVVDTVINFWLNNSESVDYWKRRLSDAGSDNLLVARVADFTALQAEFESLLGKNW